MPSLNLPMLPMPWLGQPADPGGALARGVRTGAMIRQTWDQRRLAADQSRLNALQANFMELRNETAELELSQMETQVELQRRNNAAFGQLAGLVYGSVAEGKAADPETMLQFGEIMSRNPALAHEKRTAELSKYFQEGLALTLKQKEQKELYRQQQEALAKAQEGGLEVTRQTVETPTGDVTLERPEPVEPVAPLSPIGKLQADREAARKAGNMEAVKEIDAEINSRNQVAQTGSTVTARDVESLKKAIDEGDTIAVRAFSQKLGLNETDKAVFQAKLKVINDDLLTPIEEKSKAIDALVQEFKGSQGIVPPIDPIDPLGSFQ